MEIALTPRAGRITLTTTKLTESAHRSPVSIETRVKAMEKDYELVKAALEELVSFGVL